MENQKGSNSKILQLNTSRQFYSRRLVTRTPSNLHLQKVLKFLNIQNNKKQIKKFKTESNEENVNYQLFNVENMIMVQRLKLQKAINKDYKEWKELYDLFEGYKRSSSLEMLKKNELNILSRINQMLKNGKKERQGLYKSSSRDNDKQMSIKNQFHLLKCQKQLIFLRSKLQEYQTLLDQKQQSKTNQIPKIKDKYNSKELSQQFEQIKKQKEYYQQALNQTKTQKANLTLKFNQLQMNNEALCAQILKIRESNQASLNKFQQFKNIMAMQFQEIISIKRDKYDIRKQLTDIERKYQNVIKVISKINNHHNSKLMQINQKRYIQIFSEQMESFNKIRSYLANKQYYHTHSNPINTILINPSSNNGHTKEIMVNKNYKACYSQKQTLQNTDGVKKVPKQYYRYYKPTFYVFLEQYFQYQGIDRPSFNEMNIGIGINFIITIRAILDSKYNQLLNCKNVVKQFTNLSSFSISWLSNYTIDNKKKNICSINTDVCLQTIGTFYSRLMNPQLNYVWEITTFRELLMETLSIDQLMFYLKIRNILMKGDSLRNKGSFMQIYHINYMDALLFIQDLVTDFDYRKKLQQYIKKSVEYNKQKQLIDAHFILRLVLQFYQYKKQHNFSIITKAFSKYTKQKNNSMPFQTYLKIYDYHFAQIKLLQRIQIYQKSFSLGKGMINLQSILTIMSEQGYLYYEVQKFFKKDVLIKQQENTILNVNMPEQIQNFIGCFQRLIEKDNGRKQIISYGLSDIKIMLKSQKINKSITSEELISKIQLIFNIIMLQIKKIHHNKRYKKQKLFQIINNFTIFYDDIIRLSFQKNIEIKQMEEFSRKIAGKKIIAFYLKKKAILNRLYLNNNDESNLIDKNQQIRQQFSSLIDKLKKKYNQDRKVLKKMHSLDD